MTQIFLRLHGLVQGSPTVRVPSHLWLKVFWYWVILGTQFTFFFLSTIFSINNLHNTMIQSKKIIFILQTGMQVIITF